MILPAPPCVGVCLAVAVGADTGGGDDGLDHEQDRRVRAELDRFAPPIAMNDAAWQERILDHVFLLVGLDPEWADWLPYARQYLSAYRQEDERLSV